MTLFLLLRHAAHDKVGSFLAGRMPGIVLGQAGRAQAARFGQRLRREQLAALYCSPRERTRETGEAIASATGLALPYELDTLDEIDFGDWSGKSFAELDADEAWRAWNAHRSVAVTAAGESFAEVTHRIIGAMDQLSLRHPGATVGLVTHADVIKAAVLHHLRLSADDWWRIEISPASITRLRLAEHGAQLLGLNEVTD